VTAPERHPIEVDWGSLAPLRIRARTIAEGVYAGAHRSLRKGTGVEFGGHRPYVPGDDLRWLDRRSLLRHDRLVVREFETDTDRAVMLVVDASASMAFRSRGAPAAKLAVAALLAAVLARVALASGDPVGLYWLGGRGHAPLAPSGGREAFERVVFALESIKAEGDLSADPSALDRALAPIARRARRGAIIVLLSDLLDLPEGSLDRFAALGSGGRMLLAVQVLDPEEASFPFSGTVRLRPLEGHGVVETDAERTRAAYLSALDSLRSRWGERLRSIGGLFIPVSTTDDVAAQVRALLAAIAGRGTHEKEPA
jgi:uncharacterized protein (DUF58 family)